MDSVMSDTSFQTELAKAIVGILGLLLTWLTGEGIKLFRARYKFVSEELLQNAAKTGVAYAEEVAANALKAGLGKLDGATKLKVAIDFLASKVPNVDQSEAERIVKAELVKVGLGAASTLSALAQAARTPEGQK